MTIVKAGGKDLILPGDGFDAFVDFLFNTPSQPEMCEMKKEGTLLASRLAEPTTVATAANNGASTRANSGKGATTPVVATLSPETREKKNNPGSSNPTDNNAKNCTNAGKTVEDFHSSFDGEEKGDDEAYHQPYAFKLSMSYLESIKKQQNSQIDYSDSHSVTSGVGGDSSAWSFSAVGKDDDTYASIEDNTFGAVFHYVDESDEPAVNKPYFLKSSSSYLSEKSGYEDGNASTWSYSAVGADNETYVSGRIG